MNEVKMVIADWFMTHSKNGEFYQGVKKRNGEKIMRVSEVQEMANEIIEMGAGEHGLYKYLFNDLLIVQQGVFKWNEKSKSFKKVSDTYDGISYLKPLFGNISSLNIDAQEALSEQINDAVSKSPKTPDLNN